MSSLMLRMLMIADDCIFPSFTEANKLIQVTRAVMTVIFKAFARHGLELNMSKGKTAAMFFFFGKGANNAKISYQKQGVEGTWFKDVAGNDTLLVEEQAYKHVGRTVISSHQLHTEIIVRFRPMKAKYKKIRRKIIKSKGIPRNRKLMVGKSHLHSRALYLAGTWGNWSQATAKRIHSGIMSVYRGVLSLDEPGPQTPKMTDPEVIAELQVLAPLSLVVFENLSTFVRVFSNCSPPLLLA